MVLINIQLRQGDFSLAVSARVEARALAVLGSSGAGKTTMLEAIAGLRRPASGEIRIEDRVLYSSAAGIDLPPWRRKVGYVPQDVALFPHLDVRGNVLYGARDGARVPLARVLEVLEIGPLFDRRVAGLSGGERQRVALARALMAAPDLLLLDEPLAALDVPLRRRIVDYIVRVRDDMRVPLVYVTHDAEEARLVADEVLTLAGGQGTLPARSCPPSL